MAFDWDAANLKHIARHGITPEEAEEAALIEPLAADVQQHESEQRVLCFWPYQIRTAAYRSVYGAAREDPSRYGL